MELTKEEKKKIVEVSMQMLKTFCEFRLAEDRLAIMNGLTGNFLKMGMDKQMVEGAMAPYVERFRLASKVFYNTLGIDEKDEYFFPSKPNNERPATSAMPIGNPQ